jgi:uncharacterized membrane protein
VTAEDPAGKPDGGEARQRFLTVYGRLRIGAFCASGLGLVLLLLSRLLSGWSADLAVCSAFGFLAFSFAVRIVQLRLARKWRRDHPVPRDKAARPMVVPVVILFVGIALACSGGVFLALTSRGQLSGVTVTIGVVAIALGGFGIAYGLSLARRNTG